MRMKKGCDDSPMGSDYLLVLGIILLCNFKTAIFGILCIIAACMIKKKKRVFISKTASASIREAISSKQMLRFFI